MTARAKSSQIHRLRVPLPFAMAPLNAWLIDSGDGWILLDTGMQTGAAWQALEAGVLATGVRWSDIRTIIITHMHPDHVGLVPRAREASAALLAMHGLDADLLREFAKPEMAAHWNGVALGLAGSPPEMLGPVNAAFHLLTVSFPALDPDLRLVGGERFGSLEVMWSPGHSPGHICLLDRGRRVLFSGDHLIDTVSPNIGWLPDGNPLGDYLASLAQVAELDIETVLPGHGEPIPDHRGWIAKTVAHHRLRLARICEIVAEHPRTAHEISLLLWDRTLTPVDYRFAIFEVLAHLIHLEAQGAIEHHGHLWTV